MNDRYFKANCERCGMDRKISLEEKHLPIDPVIEQFLAGYLGCPRSPRICGTIVITEEVKDEA
jgi:hypothetical protein